MRLTLLTITLALTACVTSAPREPAAAPKPTGMVGASAGGSAAATAQARSPLFNTEVLPSIASTATVKSETPLLQRPISNSATLSILSAGTVVQLLGNLDNAEGQWLSVSLGDAQGWVRAVQVTH